MLTHIQTNTHWRENRLKFVKLRGSKDGFKKYANEETENTMCIRQQLNQYELISCGIDCGVLDEGLYKKYFRGTFLRDLKASKEFIDLERAGSKDPMAENKNYWIECEKLGEKFKSSD